MSERDERGTSGEPERSRALTTGRTVHRLADDGTVRDWLVAPVWSRPCDGLDALLDADGSPWGPAGRWVLTNGPDVAPLKRRLHERHPLRTEQVLPVLREDGPMQWLTTAGPRSGTWARRHVGADGFVDWSAFCFTPEYREAVAATRLEVDQAEERVLEVASTGPFRCWVGGELILTHDEFTYMEPLGATARVRLPSGTTDVVVATWQVALRECRHILRLRVRGLPVRVVVPNPNADEYRSSVAERILAEVGSTRWAAAVAAELVGPPGTALRVAVDRAGAQRLRLGADGTARVPLGDLPAGESTLTVRIDDPATPVQRRLTFARLPSDYRPAPVGGPAQWCGELLAHVGQQRGTVACALARQASGTAIDADDLRVALARIETRGDCADFEILGLLHLWHRLPAPAWPVGLSQRVEDALVAAKYWIDQPGLDAMCYFTENHQLVWHVAQRLAGLAWPEHRFSVDGRLGVEHAAEGAERAGAWIARKFAGGFSEFDSNAYLAIDALALVSLVEFDDDPDLRASAEALLDKTLLSLAANSWRGVHGAAHGRSYVRTLRSSRFEETAPILWLLAGVGSLNANGLPATALATAESYRAPDLIRALAGAEPEQWWGRQVYRGRFAFERDLLSRPYGSDVRVWRTPGAMLSSVQDYRAALPGLQEHVWGATLGPEVQVFATHPANGDSSGAARPNAWAGQRVLPHARQDRDAVLVLHAFPTDDPSPRTHLWLPVAWCDQWEQHGSWLAARVGDGYVAVATPGGVRPVRAGDTAWQEWTPIGSGTAWVATVGWAETDGEFDEWVARLAEPVEADGRLSWTAHDGRILELSWDGTFLRDGAAVDLNDDGVPEHPPHLDNPAVRCEFGAHLLEARWANEEMVLDQDAARRLEPPSGIVAAQLSEVGVGR
ncbi:MAG: hypothetical protein ACT4QG_14195 [Sporichthyaceae bacterium]